MTRIHGLDQPTEFASMLEMMLCLAIKILQCFCRKRGMIGLAPQTEMFSPPGDGDIKYGFNLPEVFIQRPAEVGKTLVIGRRKGNFGRLGFQRLQLSGWVEDA